MHDYYCSLDSQVFKLAQCIKISVLKACSMTSKHVEKVWIQILALVPNQRRKTATLCRLRSIKLVLSRLLQDLLFILNLNMINIFF